MKLSPFQETEGFLRRRTKLIEKAFESGKNAIHKGFSQ